MAEALGGIASVLTIVESIAAVTKTILSCKSATRESRRLVRELSYIRGLLSTLKETIEEQEATNDTWKSTTLLLNDNNGLLHQFQQLLDLLEIRIRGPSSNSGFQKLKGVLEWPYKESEALRLVDAIERYKSLFELALESNHIRLSTAIRDDVKILSELVQDVVREARQSNHDLQKVQEEVAHSKEEWQKARSSIENLHRRSEDADFDRIYKQLSTWNFWTRQRDILAQRVGATGDWLFTTSEYKQWETGYGRWLTCYGAPGVGKSVLASIVVHHLQKSVTLDSRVLAFYFDRAYRSEKRYEDFLGSLLQQLIRERCSTLQAIKDTFQQRLLGPDSELTPTDLISLLKGEFQHVDRVYLILDALDEWNTDVVDLTRVLADLESLGCNVNILIMSRPLPQCAQVFKDKVEMELQFPFTDLEIYISARLKAQCDRAFLKQDPELQDLIRRTILDKCEGLFLLARLQMDQLKGKTSKKSLLRTLRQLPRTPDALYNDIMARVVARDSEEANLAKQTFAWVFYAREPPHIHLIQYALAIEPYETVVDNDGIVEWDVLGPLCGGLVVLDREALTLRFVHPTTRSYFEHYFERQCEDSEALLTSTCVTFFLSTTFENFQRSKSQSTLIHGSTAEQGITSGQDSYDIEMQSNDDVFNQILHSDFPPQQVQHIETFIYYAARHLVFHYRLTERNEEIMSLMQRLFGQKLPLANFWHVRRRYSYDACGWALPSLEDPDKLSIACFLGFERIVAWLLQSGSSPNERDSTGQTPLYAAASRSEIEVIRVLLDYGAEPHLRSFDDPQYLAMDSNAEPLCYYPMHCALRRGNLAIAQLLIDHGVKMAASSPQEKQIHLQLAIESGNRAMVEFVLQKQLHDFSIDPRNDDHAVNCAINNGAVEILEFLLKSGAPTTSPLNRGLLYTFGTAILAPPWRVRDRDCSRMCQLILDHMTPGQQQYTKENIFRHFHPLKFLRHHRMKTLTSLKARFWKSNYNDPSSKFGPFWQKLFKDDWEDVKTITRELEQDNPTVEEFEQSNVLPFAAYRGWTSVVQNLLPLADALHCPPVVKTMALCEAIELQHSKLISLILESTPELNMGLPNGSPLSIAVLSEDLDIIRSLLKAGAAPNFICPRFGSAIHAACVSEELLGTYAESVISLLIEYGADINLVSDNHGTALAALAETSSVTSLELTPFLLSQGANCNVVGGPLYTPLIAAAASSRPPSIQIMELLKSAGAELDASGGRYGTALLAAAEPTSYSSEEKLLKLFEWGSNATVPGPKGTLIELAIKHPDPAVRNLILGQSDKVDRTAFSTALVEAAAFGSIDTMIQLIEEGADVNGTADFLGASATPLVAALISEVIDADILQKAQLLVLYGANLETPATGYSNVLQMYLDCKIPEFLVIEYLVNAGISINAPSGPAGLGTALEIVLRHYKDAAESQKETWSNIMVFLHRNGGLPTDDDLDFLLQHPWFLQDPYS